MNRRMFLKQLGVLSAAGLSSKLSFAYDAIDSVNNKTIVSIFLRGGADLMSLLVPYGDADYYERRKNISVALPGKDKGAVKINDFYGWNPRAVAMQHLIDEKLLRVVHGVGNFMNTRSHFKEQDIWETGNIKDYDFSNGWANGYLKQQANNGLINAIAIGDNLPRILKGSAKVLNILGLHEIMPKNGEQSVNESLSNVYNLDSKVEFEKAGGELIRGMEEIRKKIPEENQSKEVYPNTSFGKRMKDAARMIKANIGLKFIEVDEDGWDTHQNQGNVDGSFGGKVDNLSKSLASFCKDLGDKIEDTLVLVYSEFGRTVSINGTNGTDHGWGNDMYMIGGVAAKTAASKGSFANDWVGLKLEKLNKNRDLAIKVDFRDVFCEVLHKHAGCTNAEALFKGHKWVDPNFLAI